MKLPILLVLTAGTVLAQVPNPTQQQNAPVANTGQPMPIFRVTVVSRTTKAVNYHHRTGSTHIDFRGTELMPAARGEAPAARGDGVQHRMIVGAVTACLNDDGPFDSQDGVQCTQALFGSIGRCIRPARRVREPGRRAEHVAVRVARPPRQFESRYVGVVIGRVTRAHVASDQCRVRAAATQRIVESGREWRQPNRRANAPSKPGRCAAWLCGSCRS